MCCFTRPVEAVTNTRIFARMRDNGSQVIVYSMTLKSKEDVAMVLPLPVARGKETAPVKFVSLKGYPSFFSHLEKGFPYRPSRGFGRNSIAKSAAPEPQPMIKVESVGAYEASYVPTIADFSRLDPRFSLPPGVWDKLPGYQDFGFAVFKLKKGEARVHPMAFTFPAAKKSELFFPTVHIHDGEVHEKADWDHTLYCQTNGEFGHLPGWDESDQLSSQFMKLDSTQGLVRDQHVHRAEFHGMLANKDAKVPL